MRPHVFAASIAIAIFVPRCDSEPAKPVARACTIAAPQADFRLATNGTAFTDSLGRTVFLRGVDAGGRSKFAPYVPFDFGDDFDGALASYMGRAASWGIDAMRVPFTWAALEPTQGQNDPTWLAHYDAILDAAWARGIWTVVDFHQDVYAENLCGDGFPGWTLTNPPAPHHDCPQWSFEYFNNQDVLAAFDAFWANTNGVQDAYFTAWDVMIARYKDKPGVLGFEPFNEPSSGSQDDAAFSSSTLSDFMAKFVAHARGLAPTSLVFIDPTGLAGVNLATTLVRPPGDGVVFAPHFYPLTSNPDTVLPNMQKWQAVGAQWNVPTFVGEFGAFNQLASTLPYMQAHFDAFDALAMNGTEWEYSVSADLWNSESDWVTDASGNELPVAQALIRPFARAVAGSSIITAFDTTTSTFTLAYAPGSGATNVTVVSFPARAYPNGYDVGLTGGCYDATTTPGEIFIQPDEGATAVSLTVTSH